MIEVRQDSSQQSKSCGWIKNFVGVILAALLLLIVFKELHSLSKDKDESRKLLKELSGRMAKIEKENENLRKELRRTEAKTRLQVFANMQKVSRVRRSRTEGRLSTRYQCSQCQKEIACFLPYSCRSSHSSQFPDVGHNCKHWHHCFKKGFNCSMIKNCTTSRGKDYIHGFVLRPRRNVPTGFRRVKLHWNKFIPNQGNIKHRMAEIVIHTRGFYFVYCRLRVGTNISKVFIWKGDSVLFSSRPTFSNGSSNGVVQMFGLAEIFKGESVYVQVEFNNESETSKFRSLEGMATLFPDYYLEGDAEYSYNASSYRVPDRNINSFGAFKVN